MGGGKCDPKQYKSILVTLRKIAIFLHMIPAVGNDSWLHSVYMIPHGLLGLASETHLSRLVSRTWRQAPAH